MVRQFFILFLIITVQLNAQGFERRFVSTDSISPSACNYTTWTIDFVFDKADFLSSSKLTVLDSLAFMLKQDTGLVIEIGVHSGLRGSDEYNNKNTLSRAEAIKDYLVKHGASPNQLMVKGYGKTNPLEIPDQNSSKKTNCDDDGSLDKNRRIEFKILNGLCDGNLKQWKLYPLTIDRLGNFHIN